MRAEGLEPPRAFAHQDLNLARIANSATPAEWKNTAMSTPEDRERESEQSAEDKFHEDVEHESEERARIAEKLKKEKLEEREK